MMNLQEALFKVSASEQNILKYRSLLVQECPNALKALRLIDHEYNTIKKQKGYNLVKRDSKKLGHIYYVRYWHDGKMIPSKWCTHTNDYFKACEFAEKNRDTLIGIYFQQNGGEAARFFDNFYDPNNSVYQSEARRSVEISDDKRKKYESIIKNKFIPFLKERNIRNIKDITVAVLSDFQDKLIASGIKSKSVNNQLVALSRGFNYLVRKGLIEINPYLILQPIPIRDSEKSTHGCYELEKIKKIFNKPWDDQLSYLLNLLIYTTDMRNVEIKNFSKDDIIKIDDCHFIDLKDSKTANGIRLVPLHPFVYNKIINFTQDTDNTEPIFRKLSNDKFTQAYQVLGELLGFSNDFLKEENITFYSGRHFWKTLMNYGKLGEDAEEVFMGHKVSSDVKKLYNHKDKAGMELKITKAKEIFAILDEHVFCTVKPNANRNGKNEKVNDKRRKQPRRTRGANTGTGPRGRKRPPRTKHQDRLDQT